MAIMVPRCRLQQPRFGQRLPTRIAAGVTLLALLASCATRAPVVRTPGVAAAPPPAAPVRAAPPPPPQIEQNRVALLVPLTGANAAVGQSIANAANLALLDVGDGRINLRVYDTASGAAAAAAKATADGARLILGPLLAVDVRAVQSVAAAQDVPILSFSNDAALAGGATFVMGFQPGQSVARVVGYARARGIERFAALVPSGTYGQRASTAFIRAVEANGGKVVSVATFTHDAANLNAAVRKVTAFDARKAAAAKSAALRPDGSVVAVQAKLQPVGFQALLIADSATVASAVVPALVQFGVAPGSVQLLGTELWNNEPAVRAARGLRGAWFASVADEKFGALAGRYRAKYGSTPSRLASLGYDAVLLVNSAAGRWPLGRPFPRALLTAADGYAGVDGVFRFGANGIAERGLEVQQVGSGTVSPAPRSLPR